MSTPNTTQPTPPEEVSTFTGMPSWRIANGTLCRGREIDSTYETKKQIVGYLRRVGVHHGTLDDGRSYSRIECVLQTAAGEQCVGANLDSKSSSLTLAEGLLECAAGELIAIQGAQAKELNRYGTKSTYANVFHVDPITHATTQIRVERDKNETLDEREIRLLGALLTHPAYGERPKREQGEGSGPTHRSELEKELAAKGWPATTEPEWLPMMNAFHETTKVSLDAFTDDHWGQIRQKLQGRDQLPKILQPAADRMANGNDPFTKESGGGNASALD